MNEVVSRVINLAFRLTPGDQARLRRGARDDELLLIPGLGALLAPLAPSGQLGRDGGRLLRTARLAAVLREPGPDHPAAALSKAGYAERRMSRLLATDDADVLFGRLLIAARFLAAKRVRCRVRPFDRLLAERPDATCAPERAAWALQFAENPEKQKRR